MTVLFILQKIHKERVEFYLKEISKTEIEKLIKAGYLKLSGKGGYVNPKRKNEYGKPMHVGYYKTCGGHRYIEDWFSDKAKNLK